MRAGNRFGQSAAALGRGLMGAGVIGMAVLLASCGGGSNGAPPASSSSEAGGSGGSSGPNEPTGNTPPTTNPTGPTTPVAQKCLLTPAAGTTFGVDANGNIHDGYDYGNCDTPVTLQNIHVTILPPTPGKTCTKADGYAGCTLADVNSGIKDNACAAVIDGVSSVTTKDNPDFKPYVKVLFSADGYTPDPSLTWNGEMKLNGHSTRCAVQKGYEIELGKGLPTAQAALVQPFHGLMDVLLKKHPYDVTRIRNSLSFYLFRSVGDIVSRPTWLLHATFTDTSSDPNTLAYLNKYGCSATSTTSSSITADCGLFEDIEEDDNWLTFHGLDPNGQLWEAQNFAFLPATTALTAPTPTPVAPDTAADASSFQAIIEEQGNHYDPANLLAMLNAVNGGKAVVAVQPGQYGNDFETVFNQYFQPDNFRTWLAMNILAENRDTSSQNFFLYEPSKPNGSDPNPKFYFAPWDYDGAWDFYNQTGKVSPQPRWRQGVSNWWDMPLMRRYLEQPGEVANLKAKLDDLQNRLFNPTGIQNVINIGLPITGVNALESASPDDAFPDVSFGGTGTEVDQRLDEITHLYTTVDRPDPISGASPEQSVVTKAMADYEVSLKRPMPMYLGASGTPTLGDLHVTWDPSYSIPPGEYADPPVAGTSSDTLVYDVVLSTSPVMNEANDPGCTAADTPVPMLADPTAAAAGTVVYAQSGIAASAVGAGITMHLSGTPASDYYWQVVARDPSTGYCQASFPAVAYVDTTTNKSVTDFGVSGFHFDPTVPYVPPTPGNPGTNPVGQVQ